MLRRLLYIAYQYPPVGGAGVQRTTKFIKYLPEFGWSTTVLTVANPSVPVLDQSLENDVKIANHVVRARTYEPTYAIKSLISGGGKVTAGGNGSRGGSQKQLLAPAKRLLRRLGTVALQPDPQVLWVPSAFRAGIEALRQQPHDAIIATAPPFSSLLLGAMLSRKTGLPLILDYRDEWTISNSHWENKRLDVFSRRFQDFMQRKIVRQADALVATTQKSAQSLRTLCEHSRSDAQVTCIYNGYDSADFAPDCRLFAGLPPRQLPLRIAYIGTLWNLASVEPLVRAAIQLAEQHPEARSDLEFVFVGRRTQQQQELLESLRECGYAIVEHPYLNHSEALELMGSVHTLTVLLSDVPGAERVVPAKLFECMAARKPILAIAPRGEVWQLLDGNAAATVLEPSDVRSISEYLLAQIRILRAGALQIITEPPPVRFERRMQARQLADLLDTVTRMEPVAQVRAEPRDGSVSRSVLADAGSIRAT